MSIAWAFQKNSPYLELFNFYIATLLESGTIDKLLKEAQSVGMLNSKSCDGEAGSSGQYEPISMKNILSAFLILISGIGTIRFVYWNLEFEKIDMKTKNSEM